MKIEMNGITLDVPATPVDPQWIANAHSALTSTVPADCKKDFVICMYASDFWDHLRLTWNAAISKLGNCLMLKSKHDRNKDSFKTLELWWWMKRSGRHDLAIAMVNDLGYGVYRLPKSERQAALADRMDKTLAEIRDLTTQFQLMRHEPDDVDTSAPMTVVRTPEVQGLRFSRAIEPTELF